MKYSLTRTRTGDTLKNDVHEDDESFKTSHKVVLVFEDLNRGESDFYYEALMDFLNRSEKMKGKYYSASTIVELQHYRDAPEREVIKKFDAAIMQAKRLSGQEKMKLSNLVHDLEKIIMDLK
jgi:hypothetical protein